MSKRDPVKTIKDLIVQEVRSDRPSIPTITNLLKCLQDAIIQVGELGLDNTDDPETTRDRLVLGHTGYLNNAITTTGHIQFGDDNDHMTANEYRRRQGGRRRRRESMNDQVMAGIDQMVAMGREGNGIVGVAHLLPHLDTLYENEADREAVRTACRDRIDDILQPVFGRRPEVAEEPRDEGERA